jgi:Carboxypeptidase regulatory-like domain/TonB dependent receptor
MIERSLNSSAMVAKRFLEACSVAISIVLFAAVPAFPQGNAGRILGTITDQTGGSIAGALITVTDTERGTTRVLTTDDAGSYNAPNLIPGTYDLKAETKGFKTTERQNITLEVGQDVRVDLSLQTGEQTQVVTVTEAIPLVDTTSTTLGGTIQNAQINDLPLNGRNFENLLDLRPGVQKYPGNAGWTNATNGNRPHDNMYLVDGVNSNDPWMAQSVMNAVMAAGDAGTMLSIDAIDEFKTEVNPRAEYGWKPGAVVNVSVKSGTNTIHGTAYAYGRDGNWDARDFFDPLSQPFPPVAVEQYGGSFGGPIKKDKLFFFGNYESQLYSVGNPAQHDVPITATGSTSANSLIGACRAAGAALTALSAQLAGLSTTCTPLPNFPGLFLPNSGSTTTINTALPSTNTIYEGIGKVDYHLSQNHSLNFMYFISPGSGTFVDNATLEIAQPWLTSQYARSQVFSGNWTWTPNSSWVNEVRAGYSHYYQQFKSVDATDNPASYAYNGSTYHLYTGQTNPAYFGLPQITFQGQINSFQLGASWPKTVGPDGTLQILDHISYLHGNHSFKFGGEFLNQKSTNNVTAYTKGPLRFGSLTSFFEGISNRDRFTAGNLLRHLSDQGYAAFFQDDWRLKPRITLNLGIRYELNTVVKEANNLEGNFSPTVGLEQVGKQIGSAFNGDHNNFSPRLGIAWDLQGNGKTVVRAGGSIIYEQSSFDSFMAVGNLLGLRTEPTGVPLYAHGASLGTAGGTINVGTINFTGGGLKNVDAAWAANGPNNPLYNASPACGDGTAVAGILPTPQPCTILGTTPNLRTPYVATWMLDVQRAITNNLSLDAAYVGNRGIKLLGMTDLNQAPVGSGWGNPAVSGSPSQMCLASANDATGGVRTPYDNCAPDSGLEAAAAPFAAKFPYLGYVEWLSNNNFSTYNGLQVSLTQRTNRGLSFVLGYTLSHSLGTGYDNWSFLVPINSYNPKQLYGNTVFDITHRLTYSVTYLLPGKKTRSQLLDGWSVNSILTLESGAPWGVNDASTDFSGTNEIGNPSTNGEQWDFFGNVSDFKTTKAFLYTNSGLGGIPYFPGCTSNVGVVAGCTGSPSTPTTNAACNAKAVAIGPLAVASLANLGCYANGGSVLIPPAYGTTGNLGVNPFRGPGYVNWDFSISKSIRFGERLNAQFRAEFFNVLNHPNIANPFGGPGGDNTFTDPTADAGASFGFRPQTPDVTSSNPVLGSGGPRAMQLGLKLIF